MGCVISGFSGFSIAAILCMYLLPAYPIEIDNPYVKSSSTTPLPLPKPSYGRPLPQTGYHPQPIEVAPRSRIDSSPNTIIFSGVRAVTNPTAGLTTVMSFAAAAGRCALHHSSNNSAKTEIWPDQLRPDNF